MIEENVKILDIPIRSKRVSDSVLDEVLERRKLIADLALDIGFDNLDDKVLAKQYKVTDRTIRRDIHWIKGQLQFDKLREAQIRLHIANNKVLKDAMMMLASSSGKAKLEAMKVVIEASKNYERYLESFKIKEKTPDKHDHTITGYRFEFVEENPGQEKREAKDSVQHPDGPGNH